MQYMVSTSTTTWEHDTASVTLEVHIDGELLLTDDVANELLEQFKATLSGNGFGYAVISKAFHEEEK